MSSLRRWQLNASDPLALELAADARLSQTDYTDDQVWQLALGAQESPALALQTRYGGRVGLASIVPMWIIDGRTIYQAQGYAKPPILTAFAPGYLQAQAALTPQLQLRSDHWAVDSHTVGTRYTLANISDAAMTVRLDLIGMVGASNREQPLRLLNLPKGGVALSLGSIGALYPVIVLEGAHADESPSSSKLTVTITIPARGKTQVRWVHAGLRDINLSLAQAQKSLTHKWTAAFKQIAQLASAIPVIETGDRDADAAIAFSYQQLIQAYLRPTGSLPHASFVAARQPERGVSARGDGTDHIRSWSGQPPTLSYLTTLATASIDPTLAQGILLNYLAVQQDDGAIDWKPGLAGQRQDMLCLPILARLAWGVFQYTEDSAFLAAAFPALMRFFERWLAPDLDADGDGVPEWQSEAQTGYAYFPTFGVALPSGQHVDSRMIETPDLVGYLLSEAISLREMAYYLRDEAAETRMVGHVTALTERLEQFWRDSRYAYRDRDTHETLPGTVVLEDGAGDEQHIPAETLTPPNRLIVRVSGGLEHVPQMTLHLEGSDTNGQPIHETANANLFTWTTTRGVYTSRAVFSRVDRVWFEGLIRLYRVRVTTPDTTRLDINAVLPLWSVGLPAERVEPLVDLLTNVDHFWRANGVTMMSARDAAFGTANANASAGVWAFWLTLIGEGLIECGRTALAADLLERLMRVQTTVLKREKAFSEFYHSDEPHGLGERGHIGGVVPLHLLMRVLGVRVVSPRKVWTGGAFAWDTPVTVRQHGITIKRGSDGTQVTFASGHSVALPPDAPWQEVIDPTNTPPATSDAPVDEES